MKNSLKFSPKLVGQITMVGVVWFWLSFVLLGMIQPSYQPIRDTISILAIGQYGWIQSISFLVLATVTVFLGLGMSQSLTNKLWSPISYLGLVISLSTLNLIIFPADANDSAQAALVAFSSTHGAIHFYTTLIIMGLLTLFGWFVWKEFSVNSNWQTMRKATFWLIGTGFLGGIFWVAGRYTGLIYPWKGLFQKLLVTDALIWLWLVGKKLTKIPA